MGIIALLLVAFCAMTLCIRSFYNYNIDPNGIVISRSDEERIITSKLSLDEINDKVKVHKWEIYDVSNLHNAKTKSLAMSEEITILGNGISRYYEVIQIDQFDFINVSRLLNIDNKINNDDKLIIIVRYRSFFVW